MPVIDISGQPTNAELMAVENPTFTVEGLSPPEGCEPYDYQKVDATWAILRKRCCIAEYPAAGKKLIAIMAALKLIELGKIENACVVSLGSDVSQWVEEIHEWTDGIDVEVHRGSKAQRRRRMRSRFQPHFTIMSYQTAAADLAFLANRFQLIILDEVSFIKNPRSNEEFKSANPRLRAFCAPTREEQEVFFAIAEIGLSDTATDTAEYVWGLSATPYETSPMDVFSLFWTLHGQYSPLGSSPTGFKQMNCRTKKFKVKVPKYRNGRRVGTQQIQVEKILGASHETLPIMKGAIEPFWIRHPWEVVAEHLPDLEVEPIWLPLGKRQKERYIEITQGELAFDFYREKKGKEAPRNKKVEYALKQFYQLRCCDGLTSLPNQKHSDSVKLQKYKELITGELGGEKLITFSRFHQPLLDIAANLDEMEISYGFIKGGMDEDDITELRRQFEKPSGPLILLVTAKASYALNLQTAHYGIAFNSLFNPKKLEQLWGRNRRRQKGVAKHLQKAVVWYHLLCEGTAEEAQWKVLRDRADESAEWFGDEEDFFSELTPSEQEEILYYGIGSEELAFA